MCGIPPHGACTFLCECSSLVWQESQEGLKKTGKLRLPRELLHLDTLSLAPSSPGLSSDNCRHLMLPKTCGAAAGYSWCCAHSCSFREYTQPTQSRDLTQLCAGPPWPPFTNPMFACVCLGSGRIAAHRSGLCPPALSSRAGRQAGFPAAATRPAAPQAGSGNFCPVPWCMCARSHIRPGLCTGSIIRIFKP